MNKQVLRILEIYIWNFYLKIDFKIQTCLFTKHDSLQANPFEHIPTFTKTPHHSLVVRASLIGSRLPV